MKPEEQSLGGLSPKVEATVSLVKAHLGQFSSEQAIHGERNIRARFGKRVGRRGVGIASVGIAAIVASMVVVVLFRLPRRFADTPLSYQIDNGALVQGQVVANGNVASRLRFSDGTEIGLDAQTKARVRSVTARGASIVMTEGRLYASVVHSKDSDWHFDAGPYSVRITGTSFELLWEPKQDRFELRLEQGSVTVHAPISNGPIPVRAGQWLTIRSRNNEVLIRDLSATELVKIENGAELNSGTASSRQAPVDARVAPVAPTASANATTVGTPTAVPSVAVSKRQWSKALAQGKLEQIVEEAQTAGLENCLATASSEELSALADAARYTRRSELAKSALLAQRRRFGNSTRAYDATFILGKMAEAEHDSSRALSYFDTYLKESPSGRYAGDSLGRRLAIVRQTQGNAAARPVAEEYLSRYPSGAYAQVARAILSGP